jgi:hypothetical protein
VWSDYIENKLVCTSSWCFRWARKGQRRKCARYSTLLPQVLRMCRYTCNCTEWMCMLGYFITRDPLDWHCSSFLLEVGLTCLSAPHVSRCCEGTSEVSIQELKIYRKSKPARIDKLFRNMFLLCIVAIQVSVAHIRGAASFQGMRGQSEDLLTRIQAVLNSFSKIFHFY